jgi:Fic family protein
MAESLSPPCEGGVRGGCQLQSPAMSNHLNHLEPLTNHLHVHTEDTLDVELPKLVKFANDQDNSGFIHPLFKAITLHFWIGLLHPFEDGNGRLARIMFYWYMLRKGYWAFSYLSLSERIQKSPSQYAMAYVNAEQDGCDLNYFIQYNIDKLKLAREQLQKYLSEKIIENRRAISLIQKGHGFNQRQIRLLQYLAKDEQRMTSPSAYNNVNSDIGYVTAMADLKKLVEGGLEQAPFI